MKLRLRTIALFCLVAAACGDDPVDLLLPDTYGAVEVNGTALPAMLVTYSTGDGIRLIAASLTLREPDSAFVVLQTQYVSPSGAANVPVTDTTRARYQVQGTSLQFTQSGAFTMQLQSGELRQPREVYIIAARRLPPSQGLGTYPVNFLFRR